MWGYPVHVLDTMLQQRCKLLKWQLQSNQRIFFEFSPNDSSDVPMILNPDNGHISSQFHVIFDDSFSTVISLSSE